MAHDAAACRTIMSETPKFTPVDRIIGANE
jgi:hypothetical protein